MGIWEIFGIAGAWRKGTTGSYIALTSAAAIGLGLNAWLAPANILWTSCTVTLGSGATLIRTTVRQEQKSEH